MCTSVRECVWVCVKCADSYTPADPSPASFHPHPLELPINCNILLMTDTPNGPVNEKYLSTCSGNLHLIAFRVCGKWYCGRETTSISIMFLARPKIVEWNGARDFRCGNRRNNGLVEFIISIYCLLFELKLVTVLHYQCREFKWMWIINIQSLHSSSTHNTHLSHCTLFSLLTLLMLCTYVCLARIVDLASLFLAKCFMTLSLSFSLLHSLLYSLYNCKLKCCANSDKRLRCCKQWTERLQRLKDSLLHSQINWHIIVCHFSLLTSTPPPHTPSLFYNTLSTLFASLSGSTSRLPHATCELPAATTFY